MEGAMEDDLLIPAFAAKHLLKYAPDEYALTDGWIHFRTEDDTMFSCRVFKDEYPDLDAYLTVTGEAIEFPKDLSEILGRATVFANDPAKGEAERVRVSVTAGALAVRGEGARGWFEESTKISYTGGGFVFEVHAGFFQKVLSLGGTATINDTVLGFSADEFDHVVSLYVS
jgi:hypothetical protein